MPAGVIVIGGGISGLAAGVVLKQAGADVRLLEAGDRLGGPIFTERRDGYIIDAGPDSFLSSKPGGIDFARSLGISDELVNTDPDGGGTFIIRHSRMQPLPEGITMLVPTQFRRILESPLLDWRGKLRLLADYFIPARPGDEDEAVAAFMTRRVGRQAFENLAEPLLSGIFAGDASRLSILSTFPRLREAERRHGGLIRAALAVRKAASAGPVERPYTPFVSFRDGLGSMVNAAAAKIGADCIHLGSPARSLEPLSGGSFRVTTGSGEVLESDAIILATPAGPTAELLDGISPEAAALLREIPYVSSATVSMAYREQDVAERAGGRGFVVPRVEGFDLTAVTWSSRKFAGRAPEGEALLRGFVGRAGNEEPAFLPDDRVIEIVRRDLAAITDLSAEPLFASVHRWHNAMPQYHVGHQARVGEIERAVSAIPGLEVVGAAYHGVGIPDCISTATATARNVAMMLGLIPR